MCGILGHFGYIDHKLFVAMTEPQKHRGPDHSGHFFSSCKNYAIVFNGEIYNAPELRREIQQQFGHIVFKTKNSDTEALLNGYIAFGPKILERLEGMFAFVIVDFAKNRILIARDHFGQKPLHYAQVGGALTISSEIAPIKMLYKDALHRDSLSLAKF